MLLAAGLLAGGLQVPVVMKQKDKAYDMQIVDDYNTIEAAVTENSVNNNGKLPASLDSLHLTGGVKERQKNYKYSLMVNGVSYQLCATFKTDASVDRPSYEASEDKYEALSRSISGGPDVENHKKGEQCFTYTVSSGFDFDNYYESLNSSPRSSNTSTFFNDEQTNPNYELKTNINSIASQLEGYFATEGTYPTAAQLADSAWRASHQIGAINAFTGPNGEKIGAGYTYSAGPIGCNGDVTACETFSLSVKLSDGTTYTKKSLN